MTDAYGTGIDLTARALPRSEPWDDALTHADDAQAIAAVLLRFRDVLLEPFVPTVHVSPGSAALGLHTCARLTRLTDDVISRMFQVACARSACNPERVAMTVVATGGYGRRELSPYSDVDITFVAVRDGDAVVDRVIRAMFTLLMDVVTTRCRLEVGYAYRLLGDCGSLDHQTQSGLLDCRFICGSSRIFLQLEDAFWSGFNATDFIFTKLGERERMLEKWGRTPRVVEPELKEGAGGLRDIHTAVWLVQARKQLSAARVRGERAVAVLSEAHVPDTALIEFAAARDRLMAARNALHFAAQTGRDHLVVTRQEQVAEILGYHATDADPVPGVEKFMSHLYQDLAVVRRVASHVMHRVKNSRLILGIGLDCRHGEIVPANDALEFEEPLWPLWAFELAQRYGLQIGQEIQTAASAVASANRPPAEPQRVSEIFTRIISKLGSVYETLQQMADLGTLGSVLPEFQNLLNLIPYDPSHDYTVGQHSLYVVRELEALLADTAGEDAAEMRRILLEIAHPEQLILAALLHDSGKAIPGQPHEEVSEQIAFAVCRRLGWTDEAAATVQFLTRQHLVMAEVSRLRDIQLDDTIRDFTRTVDDPDRLNMLYLLTYADTRAVGAGVWTPVKARFLRDLWRRSSAVLTDEEVLGFDDVSLARARRRLMKDLSPENLPEDEISEHVEAMPPYYLLNHNLAQIALHINFVRQVRSGHPVIDFHDSRDASFTELTVCAYDEPRPGLLAKIAGVLYAADLEVHSAQVITRETKLDRIVLDTLTIDYRGRPITPGKRRQVMARLLPILEGRDDVGDVSGLAARTKTGRELGPSTVLQAVRFDLSATLTVLDTYEADARGALYHASAAFARLGWDIRSARVSPWGEGARASFYVEGVRQLPHAEIAALFESAVHQPAP